MKREVKELKRIARGNLQGNFLELIRAFVFCNITISLIEMPFSMMTNEISFSTQNIIYYIAVLLITIASVVLTVGQYCLHLSIARTGEIHLSDFFYPIKYDSNRLILTELLLFLIEIICLSPILGAVAIVYFYKDPQLYPLVFVLCVAGTILYLLFTVTFGLTYFILIDQENLSVREALKATLQLIKTHKGRFLYLQFSFIGMYFLVALTLGIGILWVQPYIFQTTTLFYLDIKGELDDILENRLKKQPSLEPVAFDIYA